MLTIGQTALTANSLTWVDYQNGVISNKATVTLPAGTHTLVLTAGTEDLQLDRVMLISDACTPTGTGDNCNTDAINPTASITAPTNTSTVSGTINITATAADNDAIDRVEFYSNGNTLLGSDSSSPYAYSWDTTTVVDGAHTLTVRAYDISGNTVTSATVNVTVNNTPAPDIDSDGDGIMDSVEQAGVNGGDANNDGISDHLQPTVVSFVNAKTNQRNLIVSSGPCNFSNAKSTASSTIGDQQGRWSFELGCANSRVTIYLDKVYDHSAWKVVKQDTALTTKADITRLVEISPKTLGATTHTTLSYDLIDGGELDEDGIVNGTIVDPVAILAAADIATELPPATQPILAETGASIFIYTSAAVALLAAGAIVFRYAARGKSI